MYPLIYLGCVAEHPTALNKLEKVALRCARKRGKPLILVINNVHFFKNDDDGRSMLLQLQQRAETWAASGPYDEIAPTQRLTYYTGILTMVFTT